MIALTTVALALGLGAAVAEPAPPTPPTPPTEPAPPTPPTPPGEPAPPAPPAPVDAAPEDMVEPSESPPTAALGPDEVPTEAEMRGEDISPARPHFVFINTYGLTAGVNYFPSWDSSFFFGGALRKREKTPRRWALGYQLTASLGGADRYSIGAATLRHHLAAYTYSASGRLLAAASIGGAFFLGVQPAVLEGEGRIAYVFGKRRQERRLAGMVGGMLRLGWNYYYKELVPMPQVGAFVGFAVR